MKRRKEGEVEKGRRGERRDVYGIRKERKEEGRRGEKGDVYGIMKEKRGEKRGDKRLIYNKEEKEEGRGKEGR